MIDKTPRADRRCGMGQSTRKPIGCVTFDLWETLFIDEPERERRRTELRCAQIHEVLSKHGIKLPLEDISRAHDQSGSWLMETWKRNEEIPTVKHVKYMVDTLTHTTDLLSPEMLGELEEAYSNPVLKAQPILDPEAFQTLQTLNHHCKVGLICNIGRSPGRILRQLMGELGILRLFNTTVFSDEAGWRKPDRRIFLTAARHLGVPPSNIIHVGDNPHDDVFGAKRAGMRALLLVRIIPEGFASDPHSLYALTRTRGDIPTIEADKRIRSLSEVLNYLFERS